MPELLSQCKKDTIPYVTITDNNFLTALIERGVDKNSDGIISQDEAAQVISLNIESSNISDLKGIEAFVNLDTLNCSNNNLTSLDLSNNTALRTLNCDYNQLTSLDLSKNTALRELICFNNSLTSLDVTNNPDLKRLYCWENKLSRLDVTNNPELTDLSCGKNLLTSLDVSNNPKLSWWLSCGGNMLTSLDLSINTSLVDLNLTTMPSLSKVCVWAMPFPPTGVTIDATGSPNVYFTMNCSK